jgi:predicted phage-related endonuclease
MTPPKPEAIRQLHDIEAQVDKLQDKLQLQVAEAVLPYRVICDSREEEQWKLARQATIGASESAIIMGAAPDSWSSPLTLWAEKTGAAPRREWDDAEYMFWGHKLENGIIEGYGERTGRTTLPFGLLLRSTRWPWMSATPDALVTDSPEHGKRAAQISRTLGHIRAALKKRANIDNLSRELAERCVGWWPLQIKNIGYSSAEHWTDGVPLYYRIQCTHEALVYGAGQTTAAALIAGQKLAWDDVPADARTDLLSRQIVNLTKAFMDDYITPKVQPAATSHESARHTIAALYPRHVEGRTIALGGDLMQSADMYDQARSDMKAGEKLIAEFENLIRQTMQDAERCVFPDGSGFTLKANKNGVRSLLRKKAKE